MFEATRELPDAANPYDSLSDGLIAAGRLEEARKSYERAVQIGEATGDPSLPTFRANLERATREAGGD